MQEGSCEIESVARELITTLPVVVARPLQRLITAKSSTDINDSAKMVLNYTLRFLGQVCISDYLAADDWYDPVVTTLVSERVKRNSQGHWVEITRSIIASATSRKRPTFLRELPDTWQRSEHAQPLRVDEISHDDDGPVTAQRRFGRLEYLVNHRNHLEHGRIMSTDEMRAELFRQRAIEALAEYAWLGRYEVWLQSPGGWWCCRGLHPALVSTSDAGRRPELYLRLPDPASPTGAKSLRLLPLVVPRALITPEALGCDTDVAVYGQLVGERKAQYTGPSLDPLTLRVAEFGNTLTNTIDELHALLRRKEFPVLGHEGLSAAEVRGRILAAGDSTFMSLQEARKYTPELHVPREACEERLLEWLRSPLPLLGIHGEPGSGKTGILASLVRRWKSLDSDSSVLFLLASKFSEVADLDSLVQSALQLQGVTLDRLASRDQLNGLVLAIDGVNEHPHRDRLLADILREARRTKERGVGARFVLSWRTDDRGWIEPALSDRNLWWDPNAQRPASLPVKREQDDWSAELSRVREALRAGNGAAEPARDNGSSARAQSTDGNAPETDGGMKDTRGEANVTATADELTASAAEDERFDRAANLPALLVPPLSDDEAALIWERYREREPQRLNPRFSLEDLGQSSRWVRRTLTSPLGIRIALETFHDSEVPSNEQAEGLFFAFLTHLERGRLGDSVRRLLDLMARLVLQRRRNRVELRELEAAGGSELLFATPDSAMDLLTRRGVLTMLRSDEEHDACAFTVELVAEHALGRNLAGAEEASDPSSLGRQAVLLQDLPLSKGAIEAALRLLVARNGIEFLFQFVDAVPPEHAFIAGRVLGAHLLRSGEQAAFRIARGLLAERTRSDFEVARSAADYLWQVEDADASIELAFLEALVDDALDAFLTGDPAAGELLRHYARCRFQHHFASSETDSGSGCASGAIDWLTDVLRQVDGMAPVGQVLDLLNELGWQLRNDKQHAEAAERFAQVVARITPADRQDPEMQRRLLRALHQQARALESCQRLEEAIALFRRSPIEHARGIHVPGWVAEDDLLGEVRCLESLGRWEEALPIRERLLRIAEASGERRRVVVALEYLARAQQRSGLLEEAIACFERSLHAGLNPVRCEDWYPAVAANAIARIEGDRGNHGAAIAWRRRCLEFENADFKADLRDRRSVAIEHELLGDALREAGRTAEAINQYRLAIDFGSHPDWCENWNPALVSLEIARCHIKDGRPELAQSEMHDAVRVAREHGEAMYIARALIAQATVLQSLEHHADALACLEAALVEGDERATSGGWSPTEALEYMVDSRSELGDLEGARNDLRQLIAVVRKRGDRRGLAIALERDARLLQHLHRPERALAVARESVNAGLMPDPCPDWSPVPAATIVVEALESLGQREDAIQAAREFVRRSEACPRRDRAIMLEMLGDTLFRAGQLQEAADTFLRSSEVGMKPAPAGNWRISIVLRKAARTLVQLDRVEQALDVLRQSRELCSRQDDRASCARALESDGDMLCEQGRFHEAIETYRLALKTGLEPRPAPGWSEWSVQHELYSALAEVGDLQASLEAATRSLECLEAEADRRATVVGFESRGRAHQRLGHFEQALQDAQRALDLATQGGWVERWSPLPAGSLLQDALRGLGKPSEVPAMWSMVADMSRQAGHRRACAIALEYQGDALRELGRHADALPLYAEALETGLHPEPCDGWNAFSPLRETIDALHRLGRLDEVLQAVERYLELAIRTGATFEQALAHERRASALLDLDRPDEALVAVQSALQIGTGPPWLENWNIAAVSALMVRILAHQGRDDAIVPTLLELAGQSRASGNARAETDLLVQTGRQLELKGDDEAASETLLKAIKRATVLEEKQPLLEALLASQPPLVRLGRAEEALAILDRALEPWRTAADRASLVRGLRMRADVLNSIGRHAEALNSAREAIDLGCRGSWPGNWSPIEPSLAATQALSGLRRADEIPSFWEAVGVRAREADRRGDQAIAIHRAGSALVDQERYQRAIPVLERSLRVAAEPTPVQHVAWHQSHVMSLLARCHAELGDHAKSIDWERRCETALVDDGDFVDAARCAARLSDRMLELARETDAADASRRAIEYAQRAGNRGMIAWTHSWMADLLRQLGRHREALGNYREAIRAASEPEPVQDWTPYATHSGMAICLAATGCLDDGLSLLQESISQALEASEYAEAHKLLSQKAELLQDAGQLLDAAEARGEAATASTRDQSPADRATALLAQASCLELAGKTSESETVIESILSDSMPGIDPTLALVTACHACQQGLKRHPSTAIRLSRQILPRLMRLAKSRETASHAGVDLAVMLPLIGPCLLHTPPSVKREALLRTLLQGLDALEQVRGTGEAEWVLSDESTRGLVADGWLYAAALVDGDGDASRASELRSTAELWRNP
jgi:tetratricopeptide (TPR) repeat protein